MAALQQRIAALEVTAPEDPAIGLGGFHDPRFTELVMNEDRAALGAEYPRFVRFFADLLRTPEELPEAVGSAV